MIADPGQQAVPSVMLPSHPVLLIRADASAEVGTGHLMRCLALAQAWQGEGGAVHFGMAQSMPALEARLADEGLEAHRIAAAPGTTEDALCTLDLAEQIEAAWLVVDGYHFDASFQRCVRQAQLRSLVIDDYAHAAHYWADLVLNQNLHAHESLYRRREPHTGLLLGPRYILLRREFWPWCDWHRETAGVPHRILVTLGGADAENVTMKVVEALGQLAIPNLEAGIVVGPSNPHYGALSSAIQGSSFQARLERDVADMPGWMAWADLAVTAGGSTCWETAYMGLPSVTMILAENQRPVAEELARLGISLNLDWHQDVTPAHIAAAISSLAAGHLRVEMSDRGRRLVDGQGGRRVVRAMLARPAMRARLADRGDVALLFRWANDPLVRQMSFHSDPIGWEEHQQWLSRVLASPEVLLFVVELHNQAGWQPLGQVRIDADGTTSFSLASEYRGLRLAAPVLQTALAHQRVSCGPRTLIAYIKPDNLPSSQVFVKVGFQFESHAQVAGQPCGRYLLQWPCPAENEQAAEGGRDDHHP